MVVTKNLTNYIKEKGINLSVMSRVTGISYSAIYAIVGDKNRGRPLSADEAVLICRFLDKKVEDFAEAPVEKGA